MNKRFFAVAFAIGLITVAWVGLGFVGVSWLPLAMTAVIGGVYLLGAQELRQFRAATAGLDAAVADVPQPLPALGDWLERVPASLRHAVRLRVEGERAALPGPALTPYLVGLLVMLGMLGTFLGMVLTFKGAVFALEGSTDLAAIRAALAVPIKGLGLSFGTSVAGVAASAMLGLMSAICRRERLEVARRLDQQIAGALRPFSLAHQRQESLRALQAQAQSLPAVAERLDALMQRLEQRSQLLDERLLAQQSRFQGEATQAYTALAQSVGGALQEHLGAAARIAGQTLEPVVASTMERVADSARQLHQNLEQTTQSRLEALTRHVAATAGEVRQAWTAAAQAQADSNASGARELRQSLEAFAQRFAQASAELLARVDERAAQAQAEQAQDARERLQAWTAGLQSVAEGLQSHWQRVGDESLARLHTVCAALEARAGEIAQQTGAQAERTLAASQQLLSDAQDLVRARAEAESQWAARHGQHLDEMAAQWHAELATRRDEHSQRDEAAQQRLDEMLAAWRSELAALGAQDAQREQAAAQRLEAVGSAWRAELAALRKDENQRGAAAVQRLGELEDAVGRHLATLGAALEAPMTRLLHTAAEVPQAAAGVISQLREEMSRMAERDTLALEERSALLAQLSSLLQAVNQATGEQRASIEALVESSAAAMARAGAQFVQVLDARGAQAGESADRLQASAVELAAVAEAFGQGVTQFQAGSEKLLDTLQNIEAAMSRASARSDEQLAYYVAQAREVIDLSITSQQGLVDHLRQLQARPEALEPGPA